MKALLAYPKHPSMTYWSFAGSLPYVEKRAVLPPLGLITVAAMLPDHWELRLIDMNVSPVSDADIQWADLVMTSTMIVQAPSHDELVARCKRLGVPVVAGGPYPTASSQRLRDVDHIFIGEAEGSLAAFVDDFENGRAKPVYRATGAPDVNDSPVPRFDLLDVDAYASMAVQHSRGCPFACEFCDIWKLYGRKSRVKSPEHIKAELDALHATGWKGAVFFVDDNFIGNRRLAKDSLGAIEEWQRERGFPFSFYTEASVNLGSDDELMTAMRDAGFNFVFLGIETPSVESLIGANKPVNAKLDLLGVVRRIQQHGLEVSSGFIVGFDEDTDDIFDRQIAFIQQAGIPMAMVGLLNALEGTDLYDRLKREGRLLGESQGNNTHGFELNFETRMPPDQLIAGYKRVMNTIYDPTLANYFDRCKSLLRNVGPNPAFTRKPQPNEWRGFFRTLRTIPTRRYGRRYARFLGWCLLHGPSKIPEAVRLAIQGFHLEMITREALACDHIRHESHRLASRFRDRIAHLVDEARRLRTLEAERLRALAAERDRVLRRLRRRVRGLGPETRAAAVAVYQDLVRRIDTAIAECVPSAAHAFEASASRLAALREALRREIEHLRARYAELRRRAGRDASGLAQELRSLRRARRDALRRARREVRSLPREYRLVGSIELRSFRQNLDDLGGLAQA